MEQLVLSTTGLTKAYGKQNAVSQVSLQVKEGAIYGLIGKNGAGKTTLMKMITGLANPTEGELQLFGKGGEDLEKQRKRLGILIENPGIFGDMSAFENVKLKAMAMGVYSREGALEILEKVGLSGTGHKAVKNFSMGMKQRLGIGLALIGSPDMLVLDEPINGLDPQGIIEIRNLIVRLNRENRMTIMISSHILEELSKVATDYGIIDKGELVLQISAQELARKCEKRIELVTSDMERGVVALEKIGVMRYTIVDRETIYLYDCLERIGDINMALNREGIEVHSIGIKNDNLEEFFCKVTDREVVCHA